MSSKLDLDRRNLDSALDSLDARLRVNLANIIEHPAVMGRGGFSSVTVGDLTEEGIALYGSLSAGKVAIKRLFSDSSKDLRVAFRLIREVKIWERANHSNILKLLGFHLSPSLEEALIVCPWEPRGNVNKYIADTKPDMVERLSLLLDIAQGLAYLHEFQPPVCHGDIKGDNILVNHIGKALLCDFGLAKLVEAGHSGLSTSSNFHGSVRWCSPELFHDSPRTLASDIWAYGCVVIEIIYECTPYPHIRSNASVMLQALNRGLPAQSDDLPLPEYLRQKPTTNFWDLLKECWEFESSERANAKRCIDSIHSIRVTDYQIDIASVVTSELGATAEVDAAAINDRDSQLLLAPDLNQRQKRVYWILGHPEPEERAMAARRLDRQPPARENEGIAKMPAIGKWLPGTGYAPALEDDLILSIIRPPVIELHPLLRPIPDSRIIVDPFLEYDVMFPSNTIHLSTDPTGQMWSKGVEAPATFPRLKLIRLVSQHFPWVIHIQTRSDTGVTVWDVVNAIHQYFMANASQEADWDPTGPERRKEIVEAYKLNRSKKVGARIMPEALVKGDFLIDRTVFAGMKVAGRGLCEQRMQVEKFPATFELRLDPRYGYL
ncbi:hypothetical protein FRB93_006180 [Tulasnella sp. JGI-2019a]|nr:hypothetical protein FRB93_006180 [Tulasnella sp. JGI-2019a]